MEAEAETENTNRKEAASSSRRCSMLNKSHAPAGAPGSTATTIVSKSRVRTDVQWILSSLSVAITLGLWGLFASDAKKVAGVASQVTIVPPPDPIVVTQPQPQAQTLLPGQVLLFGGTSPQPQAQVAQPQTVVTSRPRHKSGGGGPAASTGSSHP